MGASKEIKSCALKMGMGEDADRGPAMASGQYQGAKHESIDL